MLNRWYKILRKVEAASQLRISIGKTHSRGVCQRELGKDNDTIGDKHRKQNTTSEGPLCVLRDALVVVRQRPSHKLSGASRARRLRRGACSDERMDACWPAGLAAGYRNPRSRGRALSAKAF